MSLKRFIFACFILQSCSLLAQDYTAEYHRLDRSSDTAGLRLLMQRWATAHQREASYYIACFNYQVQLSKHEVVQLTQEQPDGQHFAVRDTANGTVAYLSSVLEYDSALLKQGFDCIDSGILHHPRRLDMRFGKVYVCGLTGNYDGYANNLVQSMRDGAAHGQRWLWTDGKKLRKGNAFMQEQVHKYIVQLFNVEADLSGNIRSIARTMTELWPRSVIAHADLGMSYMISGAFQEALPHLLKAHEFGPRDAVVISNIGYSYKNLGDKQKAIYYYSLLKKVGKDDYRELAVQQLAELGVQ